MTQDDFLAICGDGEELRECWKTLRRELGEGWNRYFVLYDMVLSDAGDFEAMYAAYFGVQDAGASLAILALAEKTIQSSEQVEASWFPADE